MGNSAPKAVPPKQPVAAGKVRIGVSGFSISHHTGRALKLAQLIVSTYPQQYEAWYYFDTKGYKGLNGFLANIKAQLSNDQQLRFSEHQSSPFCWLETDKGLQGLGGRDRFCEWASKTFPNDSAIRKLTDTEPSLITDLFFDSNPK